MRPGQRIPEDNPGEKGDSSMKKAVKGALWSGLIWPGLGQIALKRYKRGIALALGTTVILAAIVVKAARLALVVVDKMVQQGGPLDGAAVYNAAVQATAGNGAGSFNWLALLLVACWIVGIVDAYLIGKAMDRRLSASGPPS